MLSQASIVIVLQLVMRLNFGNAVQKNRSCNAALQKAKRECRRRKWGDYSLVVMMIIGKCGGMSRGLMERGKTFWRRCLPSGLNSQRDGYGSKYHAAARPVSDAT